MKRILSILAVVMVAMTGSVWAQGSMNLKSLGVKYVGISLSETISSESARMGDLFAGILKVVIVDRYGRVVALNGARVSGTVVESHNHDSNKGVSRLVLQLNYVETRYFGVRKVNTEPIVFIEKRPSKSRVVNKVFWGTVLGAALGTVGGKYGAVASGGFLSGAVFVNSVTNRREYQPHPVILKVGDTVWFKSGKW